MSYSFSVVAGQKEPKLTLLCGAIYLEIEGMLKEGSL